MHEYSIVQALLERIDQEARKHHASRVDRVQVSIGELAGVEVDLLKTAFETIRRSTVCDSAELEVRQVTARWECTRCGTAIPAGASLQCATCGRAATLAAGDEIMLDRIVMEAGHV